MRTTLSLDDDIAAQLRRIQVESGRKWKDVVNDLVRLGLREYTSERRRPATVRRTESVRLGVPFFDDISNVHETLTLADGESRR